MPFYELECKKCGNCYEIMSLMADREKNVKKSKCPECKSRAKIQIISAGNFNFSNPEGTDKWNSSHDYRFRHNMDKSGGTRDQRKAAEVASHVGKAPYNKIDDVSGGKHFGKVK